MNRRRPSAHRVDCIGSGERGNFLDAVRSTSTSWESGRRPLFRTTLMRRDLRVPSERANRRLRSTSSTEGNSIGLGRVSGERRARSPTPRGPPGARRPALRPPPRLGGRPDGVFRRRLVSAGTDRSPGWDGRARRTFPRGAGCRGAAQGAQWIAPGRRVGPGPDGPRVDGRLRASAWAAAAARVRRCVRIWSITDCWVMNAPWQMGHASGRPQRSVEAAPP